jgi:hypothetical protein
MSYRLQLRVTNPASEPVQTIVRRGTVFEVQDPFSGVQNLAASRDFPITAPPGQTTVIEIYGNCLNKRLAAPKNTPMRITSLVVVGPDEG